MYRISFYVPDEHCEAVKNALFAIGAGKIGDYEQCAWQTQGTGQYLPLPNSQPYQGKANQLSKTIEYKVEMVCPDAIINKALQTLVLAHPYETPAYEAYKIATADETE